jgi:hypothetical protein
MRQRSEPIFDGDLQSAIIQQIQQSRYDFLNARMFSTPQQAHVTECGCHLSSTVIVCIS